MLIGDSNSHANRNTQFYTHADGDGYGDRYPHTYALRERSDPKRRVRGWCVPALDHFGSTSHPCCDEHAGAQRYVLRIRG
jgi:hypothetical protein